MNNNLKNQKEHDNRVSNYFDKAAVAFDTFYDHKRSAFMQWVDRKFRSDIFERYYRTFQSIEPLEGKTIIDVGCGSGPYVVEAARRGCKKVVGLDMAAPMLNLARQRSTTAGVADKCEFILGAFPQNAPNETFDHAIVMGVMDYVSDPKTFMSALAQQVKISAVLSCPSVHWFRTPLRKIRYWIKRCPLYYYRRQQLEDLSKSAGFSNIKIEKMLGAGADNFVTLFKCVD